MHRLTDGQTSERSDGGTDGRTNIHISGQLNERRQTDGRMVGLKDGKADESTDGRMDGRADGGMGERMNERMDGRTDGRTE